MRILLAISLVAFLASGCDDDEPAAAAVCVYQDQTYADGELFPAGDGCNSCKCNPDGQSPGKLGCSLRHCDPDAGVDAAE